MRYRYLLVVIAFSFAPYFLFSQEEHKVEPETDVESAIIYLDGAEVDRTAKVALKAGRNKVIFKKLTPHLDPRSVQVGVPDEVSILAVSDKKNYLSEDDDNPRVSQLKDSLDLINEQVNALNDEKEAYNTEKGMLLKNQNLSGKEKGVSVTELKQAADFYRNRLMEINKKISGLQREITKKQKVSGRLGRELGELNARYNFQRTEISVLLYSDKAQTVPISIKYLVRNAGWTPAYDLKAEDIGQPINLVYRAKVYNNTDVDWKDIDIVLSTADPTQSASKPELDPWYIKYYTPTYQRQANYGGGKAQPQAQQQFKQGYIQNRYVGNADLSNGESDKVVYSQVEVSELSAEFVIDVKYSVPSDNKPYLVDIKDYKLTADFKHFAIPKKDRDAFLLARITGWEDLDLVEGTANVYFGGTYVGKSYINTRNVSDTLDLSFGRDNKILVTRTKLKEKSSTKFIGSNRKDLLAYEIVVKNNRKSSIDIEVQDQLPVSQNSDVEVDAEELSGAEHNEDTGLLKWHFNLDPGESKKIKLAFSIKYPKSKQIKYRKTKMREVRKF